MIRLEQRNIPNQAPRSLRWVYSTVLPVIEAASLYADFLAEQFYRELSGKFHNYLVFFLTNRMTFFSAPTPSTI